MDNQLREKILGNIKPLEEEDKKREFIITNLISELKKSAKKLKYSCEFFVGGSYGKATYLRGLSDIDLFVRFDRSYEDNKISSYLKKILDNSGFSYKKQKGSRDYYSLEFKEKKFFLKVEVVPNRKIKSVKDVLNSTDVSPLHVLFLQKEIKKNPKLCDEIRLAKQFFKSKKLYGAESYINGFSGHVIDILIAYFGSLENLLNDAKDWKESFFLDICKFYKNEKDAIAKMDSSKLSNLVVVDPIIKSRNAARALSTENYFKFLIIAQNFDEFREEDFVVPDFDLMKIMKGAKKFAKQNKLSGLFYVFDFKIGENSEDIVGSKLLKLSEKFEKCFKSYDFEYFKKDFFVNIKKGKCLFVFLFEQVELSKLKISKGPFVYMKKELMSFIKNKEYYFVEGNRVYAYEKRDITSIDEVNKIIVKEYKNMLNSDISFVKNIRVVRV